MRIDKRFDAAPKDKVILGEQGFIKYFETSFLLSEGLVESSGFYLTDIQGNLFSYTDREDNARIVPVELTWWVECKI